MITQLLFEHSLRMRLVAEVGSSSGGKSLTSYAGTPGAETASVTGSEQAAEIEALINEGEEAESGGHTAEGSHAQTVGSAGTMERKCEEETKGKKRDNCSDLVGRINNLMSTVSSDSLICGLGQTECMCIHTRVVRI